MYAIVKTGGKQYRVEEGQFLLVERLPADSGAECSLQPLLYVDGTTVLDGSELGRVSVEAKVLAHERGPKLRIVKFKPKHGYRRRTGHRQELTRLEVTGIKLAAQAGRDASPAAQGGIPAASVGQGTTARGPTAQGTAGSALAAQGTTTTAREPEVTDGA